ncbi:MAG: hypothetical protein ACJAZ3_000555 [Sphingobacteriales bacterium]
MLLLSTSCSKDAEIVGVEITYPDGADTIYQDAIVSYKALVINDKKAFLTLYSFVKGGESTNSKDFVFESVYDTDGNGEYIDPVLMHLPDTGVYLFQVLVENAKDDKNGDFTADFIEMPIKVFPK